MTVCSGFVTWHGQYLEGKVGGKEGSHTQTCRSIYQLVQIYLVSTDVVQGRAGLLAR